MIPGDVFDNGVGGDAVFQFHQHLAGRVGGEGKDMVDFVLFEFGDDGPAVGIVADCADGVSFGAQRRGMIDKVDRRAAGSLAAGEHVPQNFADADDHGFGVVVHRQISPVACCFACIIPYISLNVQPLRGRKNGDKKTAFPATGKNGFIKLHND